MKEGLIVFDLDGTAIDSPSMKLPNQSLTDAISGLKDRYYFSAATGRVWTFANPVLQALQLEDPCIISAGTQICNPVTGDILWQKDIPQDALASAIEVFKQHPEYKLLHNDNDEDAYFNGGVAPKDFHAEESVYFLEQVFIPDGIAIEIQKKLVGIDGIECVMVVAQKPGHRDLHVVNSMATKEHAVAELLRMLQVKRENSIAIGDGHNDIHLFQAVGHRVAMGNGVPELKEVSDEVIGSVSEDGMTNYLKSL